MIPIFWTFILLIPSLTDASSPKNHISMETAKHPQSLHHFDYVNPKAPKGGEMKQIAYGSFDNLNPFILSGIAASGIGNTFDSLGVRALDEPYTVYGLIAKSFLDEPEKETFTIQLHPNIYFSNQSKLTAKDVIATFNTLRKHGHPYYKEHYKQVGSLYAKDEYTVVYHIKNTNNQKELKLVLAQMPVLSKKDLQNRDFTKTQKKAFIGSGPYLISQVHLGKDITYTLRPDYWGKNLPVNLGRNNFHKLKILYYRDSVVALTAFKNHQHDIHLENVAKLWATGYQGKALENGDIIQESIPDGNPQGMQAFAMNLNHPLFEDKRVRKALNYAFNFSWLNRNLFYDSYTRTESFFANSAYEAKGLPSSETIQLLNQYPGSVDPDILTYPPTYPNGDAQGQNIENLVLAKKLLDEAGWEVKNFKRVHKKTQKPFTFTLLIQSPSMKRICLPFKESLERLGITMHIQMVSPSTWIRKMKDHDYAMTTYVWPLSPYPGKEQVMYWHSRYANEYGSDNTLNLSDPLIDFLTEKLALAKDQTSRTTAASTLDRALTSGYYVIPHWHLPYWRVAYWKNIKHPKKHPSFGIDLTSWWEESDS